MDADDTKREFYSTDNDIHYLSRIIYDWLVKNGRLRSQKYLVGESYGGYPRSTDHHYLQSAARRGDERRRARVAVSRPGRIDENGDLSPMAWMVTLPSIAAANLEREHALTPDAMAP